MADVRGSGSAAMLIRLSDPTLVGDLRHHFARAEFTTDDAGGSMIEVFRLDAPSPELTMRVAASLAASNSRLKRLKPLTAATGKPPQG
jgi:hypothetical protein